MKKFIRKPKIETTETDNIDGCDPASGTLHPITKPRFNEYGEVWESLADSYRKQGKLFPWEKRKQRQLVEADAVPKKKAAEIYDIGEAPADIQELASDLSYHPTRQDSPESNSRPPVTILPSRAEAASNPPPTTILRVFPAAFISASCHDGTLVTTPTAQFRRAGMLVPTTKNELFIVTLVYPDPTTRETKQVEVEFRINRQHGGTMCTRQWPGDLPFPECGNRTTRTKARPVTCDVLITPPPEEWAEAARNQY